LDMQSTATKHPTIGNFTLRLVAWYHHSCYIYKIGGCKLLAACSFERWCLAMRKEPPKRLVLTPTSVASRRHLLSKYSQSNCFFLMIVAKGDCF